MKSYRVTPELAGWNTRRKVIVFLITAGWFAAFWPVLEILWPSTHSSHLLRHSIEGVVLGTVVGLSFSLRLPKRFASYTLTVSDACVTCVFDSWLLSRRSIRREEAKMVIETDGGILAVPGLRISKYGRLGTWFWGCVWIPKTIPDYGYVRDLAFSWKASH
jgi:hypothetical protein